MQHEESVRKIA